MWISWFLAVGLGLILSGCVGSGHAPEPRGPDVIPMEQILGYPEGAQQLTPSPAGTRVAFLQASKGDRTRVMNLFVQDSSGAKAVQVTGGKDRDVRAFWWFSEHRLGFLRDEDGSQAYRLYGVNADGTGFRQLTPGGFQGSATAVLWPDPAGCGRWQVAMAGAALHPDLYRCAVAVAGPSSLLSFVEACGYDPYWLLLVGDPRTEPERLKAASPYFRCQQVRCPIFISHGARDPRVPVAESERMVAALKAHGKPVCYLRQEEVGHWPENEGAGFELYRAVELFLGEHLGSKVGPAPVRWCNP